MFLGELLLFAIFASPKNMGYFLIEDSGINSSYLFPNKSLSKTKII
jgi:hypothetical protein